MNSESPAKAGPREGDFPIGFKEFVALMAGLMAMNALSIDPMLPALPAIGESLNVADPNDRQWVVTAYFIGIGVGSMLYGSLSDRYGRRPVMLWSIALFMLATLLCAISKSFPLLLAARAACGFFAASSRVVTVSIVRDRFQGDAMARVMSLIFTVFMIVPMLAPSFGQAILAVAPWQGIFAALAVLQTMLFFWTYYRLPETLRMKNRVRINAADISRTLTAIATHRTSMGYMLASGIVMGGLIGFVTSVQQIFFDVFHAPAIFPLCFAGIAMFMAAGSLSNSRLVARFGARRMSQGALIFMICVAAVHSLVAWAGLETIWTFIPLQGLTMLTVAFTGSNFSSISLEPFAKGAGLASSFQASLTTILSACLGAIVGAHFNGTTLPLALGFMTYGAIALLVIYVAEKGKLFTRPGHAALREKAEETAV